MELQRLVRKKAILVTMVCFLILLFADICWNGRKVESKQQYAATQLTYIQEYENYVDSILESGKKMEGISVFAKQDTGAQENIDKTCKDYENAKAQRLSVVDGRSVEFYFQSQFLWIVGCLFGLIVAGIASGKQTEGLEELLYSCKNGRGALIKSKYTSVLLLNVGFTVLCNLLFFAVCVLRWYPEQGMGLLQCSVQSLPMCKDVVFCCTIWQWVVVYVAMQCLLHGVCSVIFLSLRLWDRTKLWAYVVFLLFVLIEFALYQSVKANSAGAVWKYVNVIYALTNGFGLFVYRNLTIGRHLYFHVFVTVAAILMVAGILTIVTLSVVSERYPNRGSSRLHSKLKKLSSAWQEWYGKWMECRSLTGIELCKVMLFQKGWLLLGLLCIWGYCSLDYTDISFSVAEQMKSQFVQENTGPICSKSRAALEQIKVELDQVEQEYELAAEQYEKNQLSEADYLASSMKYASYEQQRMVYQELSDYTKYLENLKEEKEIDGWYLKEESYEYLVGIQGTDWIKKGIFPMGLAILVLFVFKDEKRTGMLPVIVATSSGKKMTKRAKNLCIAILTGVVWLVMLLFELWNAWSLYGIDGMAAPVQSIQWLQWIPFPCTMGMFLIIYYLLRYCIFYGCGYLIARCGEWKRWN